MHRATWELYATSMEGDRWTRPIAIPFSEGRQDMRYGRPKQTGELYLAWPMDSRDGEEHLFQQANVYIGRLPLQTKQPGEARLKPRVSTEIATFPLHPAEKQDLARIRGYTIESGGKTIGSIGATRTAIRSSRWTATTTAASWIPIATR